MLNRPIVHLAEPSTDEQVELGTDPAPVMMFVRLVIRRLQPSPNGLAASKAWGARARRPREVQISAQIDPGNSGGPVIDGESRVVAVAFAVHLDSGMALAIPVSTVRSLLDGTLSTEPIQPC